MSHVTTLNVSGATWKLHENYNTAVVLEDLMLQVKSTQMQMAQK